MGCSSSQPRAREQFVTQIKRANSPSLGHAGSVRAQVMLPPVPTDPVVSIRLDDNPARRVSNEVMNELLNQPRKRGSPELQSRMRSLSNELKPRMRRMGNELQPRMRSLSNELLDLQPRMRTLQMALQMPLRTIGQCSAEDVDPHFADLVRDGQLLAFASEKARKKSRSTSWADVQNLELPGTPGSPSSGGTPGTPEWPGAMILDSPGTPGTPELPDYLTPDLLWCQGRGAGQAQAHAQAQAQATFATDAVVEEDEDCSEPVYRDAPYEAFLYTDVATQLTFSGEDRPRKVDCVPRERGSDPPHRHPPQVTQQDVYPTAAPTMCTPMLRASPRRHPDERTCRGRPTHVPLAAALAAADAFTSTPLAARRLGQTGGASTAPTVAGFAAYVDALKAQWANADEATRAEWTQQTTWDAQPLYM